MTNPLELAVPLYPSATALFRRNIWFLIPVVALQIVVEIRLGAVLSFTDGALLTLLTAWCWTWIAHSGYLSMAHDERLTAAHILSRKMLPNLRFCALGLCGVITIVVLLSVSLLAVGGLGNAVNSFVIALVCAAGFYMFLLSQFGIAFPAAALEKRLRLKWAFRAGKPYSVGLLFDLARGAFLSNLLLIVVFWAASSSDISTDAVITGGSVSPLGVILSFIESLLGSWAIYLGVVALTNAYRSATARPDVSRIFE